ncbi:MAG: TatD family hydrolase [Tahibacter sp.]
MLALIDSHCHIDVTEFDTDRDDVVARARAVGVVAQIVPAISRSGWKHLDTLCTANADLHPAYGLHPMYLSEHQPEHLAELAEWLRLKRPVAVGECGLDFFVEGLDSAEQHRYFNAQLELARDMDLPVIVHARRAVDAVIASIRRIGGLRGVVHSYSGSREQAVQLCKLGFFLGFGGPLTYPRATRLRDIVTHLPLEFLLLETDAPDQPVSAGRGERNEPARLIDIASCVADLRGIPVELVAEATSANARRLFAIEKPAAGWDAR